jgi:hypothetical protein
MWISVPNEYEYMLNDKSYDWCLLLPTYMSMYYRTELYIHGKVSKMLYRNICDYVQPILEGFSKK